MNKQIINFLLERTSIRDFDPHYDIPNEEIMEILALAANAPSGNNTQPWNVVVVKNKELQKALTLLSFHQKQIETASAVCLVFGDPTAYDIEHLIDYKMQNEQLTAEQAVAFRHKMQAFYERSPIDKSAEALKLDCGLFSMNVLYAIRAYGYDAVPMRGVDFDEIKKQINVPTQWVPIVMIPFGKASADGKEKRRKTVAEFLTLLQ